MNYCSRTTHKSALEAYPDVSFALKKMTERRRIQREMKIADLRQKVNEQQAGIREAIADIDNQPVGTLDQKQREFGRLLEEDWYPAWIRWALASIDNFSIDDQPATVDSLIESGPSDLIGEIFLTILKESGISTVAEKNSLPPSSSEDQAGGKTNDSTASPAMPPSGGETETAPSSTPAQ